MYKNPSHLKFLKYFIVSQCKCLLPFIYVVNLSDHPACLEPPLNIVFSYLQENKVTGWSLSPENYLNVHWNMKKVAPKSPKSWEVKPSCSVKHLMDTEAPIVDPSCAYHFANLRFNLYGNHVIGEDPFQVVELGLYYQISPSVYHFLEFVS